jgi:hypothetical protein
LVARGRSPVPGRASRHTIGILDRLGRAHHALARWPCASVVCFPRPFCGCANRAETVLIVHIWGNALSQNAAGVGTTHAQKARRSRNYPRNATCRRFKSQAGNHESCFPLQPNVDRGWARCGGLQATLPTTPKSKLSTPVCSRNASTPPGSSHWPTLGTGLMRGDVIKQRRGPFPRILQAFDIT